MDYDLVFTDYIGLTVLHVTSLFGACKCKIRVLDSFGTDALCKLLGRGFKIPSFLPGLHLVCALMRSSNVWCDSLNSRRCCNSHFFYPRSMCIVLFCFEIFLDTSNTEIHMWFMVLHVNALCIILNVKSICGPIFLNNFKFSYAKILITAKLQIMVHSCVVLCKFPE